MATDKTGYAFNVTRQAFLATDLRVADTHFQRLLGLMGTAGSTFHSGLGLWIRPCHGVHTMFMRFPIDVLYLDRESRVIRVEDNVRPWRVAPVIIESATVLELPAHTAWNTGTKVGDVIEIKSTAKDAHGEPRLRSA
ncbi:MAG: DUF192 domain-containing protein [Acidobacteriia bacterium]|nr:DUF192 domain-containing protein [Terriglobia bacterium]